MNPSGHDLALLALLLALGAPLARAEEPAAEAPHPDEASVLEEPFPVQAGGTVPRVLAYALPRPDPAWFTDERFERICALRVNLAPDASFSVQELACPAEALASSLETSSRWRFAFLEGEAPKEPVSLVLRFVQRYEEKVQVLTMHAELDPGRKAAFEGVNGPPGVKLVHPAEAMSVPTAKIPSKARKAGQGPGVCRVAARVDPDGRARDPVLAADCPDPLDLVVANSVAKARFLPRVVDGLKEPELVEFSVEYR
jgi:hypothetical protein